MGYRSSVAFCITVNQVQEKDPIRTDVNGNPKVYWTYDKAKFKEMVGFFKLSKFYEIATSPDYNLLDPKAPSLGWCDGAIMFNVDGWKWYDGYPIVDSFDELFESMEGIEGISGYFLRVGEESGDVEERQFGDDPDSTHFHAYTGMSFDGEGYLGEARTDEEEQTEQAQTDKGEKPDCAGANHAT